MAWSFVKYSLLSTNNTMISTMATADNIEAITVHFLDAQANGLEKPQFGLANGKQGVVLMQD